MARKRDRSRKDTEHLPLFDGPTDRELFQNLVRLGILTEKKEKKSWFSDVPRGEDGVKILNFQEFIASNRAWYLWLLSLHNDGFSPEEIQRKDAERAQENIRRLREHF